MEKTMERSIEGDTTDSVLSSLSRINSTLGKAIETIRPPEKSPFYLTGTPQAVHTRLRVYDLIVSTVAESGVITLHIGTQSWDFQPTAFDTNGLAYFNHVLPLPTLLDRGVDVWWSGAFDAITSWFTYTPE